MQVSLQQEALVNLEKLLSKQVKQGKAEIVVELKVRFLMLGVAWFDLSCGQVQIFRTLNQNSFLVTTMV